MESDRFASQHVTASATCDVQLHHSSSPGGAEVRELTHAGAWHSHCLVCVAMNNRLYTLAAAYEILATYAAAENPAEDLQSSERKAGLNQPFSRSRRAVKRSIRPGRQRRRDRRPTTNSGTR